jgi:hypothetical protein
MPTYLFRCRECGMKASGIYPDAEHAILEGESHDWVRDYKAENVGLTGMVQMKREREAGGSRAVRDLFLPKQRDFESPEDPDGSRGIRAWADEHAPKESNKRPLWPDMPRKTF